MADSSARVVIMDSVASTPNLSDMGMPLESIYAADTLESPKLPFVVVRMLEEQPGMAHVKVRPFDIWVYWDRGEYELPTKIGNAICNHLKELIQLRTETGFIMMMEGGARGADLVDDGFDAAVVPYHMQAVGSGV